MQRLPMVMEMAPECVPCLLGRVLYEVELCNPRKSGAAMRDALKVLKEGFEPGANSAEVATRVHQRAYQVIGLRRPLSRPEDQEPGGGQGAVPPGPVPGGVVLRPAGGGGAGGHRRQRHGLRHRRPGRPDRPAAAVRRHRPPGAGRRTTSPEVRQSLSGAKKVVYLLDNCGEDVLDALLVREIRALGPQVIGVVKGEPILTDVTMEDARRSGVDKEFDEVLTTGMFAVGVNDQGTGRPAAPGAGGRGPHHL